MEKFSFFIGRTGFESEEGIKEVIQNSRHFEAAKETPQEANALLIFGSPKQQTWLVSTGERLYCILDDIRKDEPHLNWVMPRSQLVTGDAISIDLVTHESRRSSPAFGLVDVGPKHKDWLFSKRLFKRVSVEEAIRDLIHSHMLPDSEP